MRAVMPYGRIPLNYAKGQCYFIQTTKSLGIPTKIIQQSLCQTLTYQQSLCYFFQRENIEGQYFFRSMTGKQYNRISWPPSRVRVWRVFRVCMKVFFQFHCGCSRLNALPVDVHSRLSLLAKWKYAVILVETLNYIIIGLVESGYILPDDVDVLIFIQFQNRSNMQHYTALKDKGNNLFKQKKFEDSIKVFQQAIDLINAQQPKQLINSITEEGKLYVILNINAAFAALNIKTVQAYKRAQAYCDDALRIDPKNQKGLFRRGLACKELAQLLEIQSKGTSNQLLGLYEKAKKDFEEVVILDRTNDLAQKKLSQVIKNIYRVTVSQGKEVNLSSKQPEKKEGSRPTATLNMQEKKEQAKPVKRGADMTKILKEYKIEEVTSMAREKVENQYLTQQLPKTRAELEKAMREIGKSEEVFLQFIYRFTDEYLKKIQPTFDMLFQIIGTLLKKGEGENAKNTLLLLRNQKDFTLFWKSSSNGQKKQFKQKWTSLGLSEQLLN